MANAAAREQRERDVAARRPLAAAEACASIGAARLPPLPTASSAPSPRIARAPKPITVTSTVKSAMMLVVHSTERRAAFASGTVKKRMRMCGRPAVPMKIVEPGAR